MRIPRQTDYRFILLLALAQANGRSLPLRQIADETSLPLPFLRTIASQLVRQGLVASREGARGGYRLAKQPEAITLADVLMGEQELLEAIPCKTAEQSCARQGNCAAEPRWDKLELRLRAVLATISLAEVAA